MNHKIARGVNFKTDKDGLLYYGYRRAREYVAADMYWWFIVHPPLCLSDGLWLLAFFSRFFILLYQSSTVCSYCCRAAPYVEYELHVVPTHQSRCYANDVESQRNVPVYMSIVLLSTDS
jgi:hypothetical protein